MDFDVRLFHYYQPHRVFSYLAPTQPNLVRRKHHINNMLDQTYGVALFQILFFLLLFVGMSCRVIVYQRLEVGFFTTKCVFPPQHALSVSLLHVGFEL